MEMFLEVMKWILVPLYFLVCIFLVLVVLVQDGKEGMGGLLGGGGGGSSENVHFHSKLNKLTTYVAVAFLLITVFLGLIFMHSSRVDISEIVAEPAVETTAPAAVETQPAVTDQKDDQATAPDANDQNTVTTPVEPVENKPAEDTPKQ